jgi:hypothetical protein
MALLGSISGFLDKYLFGYALGTAAGPSLRPFVQELANLGWEENAILPMHPSIAAPAVAEGVWDMDNAKLWARRYGVDSTRFEHMVEAEYTAPDTSHLYEMWRRNLITEADFEHGLRKARFESRWDAHLKALRQVLLTPAELAAARVKGHIDQTRQYQESALQGVDNERAEILYQTTGNPPGPETLMDMWNRSIIGAGKFHDGILQGNIRPEWEDELALLRHRLLTPAEIVNQHLRGWRSYTWMEERLADHGFDAADAKDLFEGQGRPISFHQVFIGERRGGVYNGPTGAIDDAFLKSLQESNIRPEWYNLAWAQRHSYPSAFVLRALVQSGDLSELEGYNILLRIGWPEALAKTVAARWAGAGADGAGAVSARVKTAVTSAITEIRAAYLVEQATADQVRGWLGQLDVDTADQDGLLKVWDVMKQVPQRSLTVAQIRKAYKSAVDGWDRNRAVEELALLGLTLDDANTLLDE